MTIDTEIYFWNYETGGDLAYYEGLAEVVLSVGLVVPKPGVFQPHIKFLLVVCTASEVVVLGVTFESEPDDPYALMHLQPNPLLSLSSDGVNMVQVRHFLYLILISVVSLPLDLIKFVLFLCGKISAEIWQRSLWQKWQTMLPFSLLFPFGPIS